MAEVPTLVFPRPSHTSTSNDNYCVVSKTLHVDLIRRDPVCYKTQLSNRKTLKLDVSYPVVFHAPSVHSRGPPQKKGVRPAPCQNKIKHVKGVCCVNPCLSAPSVPNVPNAVSEQNVGGRLQSFWQVWQNMGSNPRVVSILKEGYTLPFKQRPLLTRFPLVQSGYSSPTKNMYLKEALISLMNKLVVEKMVVRSSLAFYNRLFLVPKPNRKWRPILDLSRLNLFLNTGTFKMETPETIQLSLETGKWITSLDFSDAYFHIPIAQRSRKYLRFFLFNQTFQFTAPLEFTKVVKEVKLMAQARGIRIHQYLVTESPFPGDLPTTYPDPLGPVPTVGLGSKYDKIGIRPQTGLQFCRLPVQPDHRSSSTHSRPVGSTSGETKVYKGTSQLYSQAIHVPDRPFNCHREASVFRSPSYEAHSMASEETLARSGGVREGYPGPSVTPPPSRLVARRNQCAERTALAPSSARCSTFYRRLKRRLGRTLRGLHCKRRLVIHGKSPSYKLSGTEGSPPGSATVRASVQGSDCACCNGQHNSGIVHKQAGGMRSGSLCALLWSLLSWCHPRGMVLRARHIPGHLNVIADKLSRHNQVIQTEWSLSQQMFTLLYSRWTQPQVDLFATRFNHKLPRFVSPVPDQTAWAVDALSLRWDQLEAYAFPPPCL